MRIFNMMSSDAICAELGARIKRVRLQRNLTQQQLCAMTNSSLSSIRRLEAQGQGSVALLVGVAQALQVSNQLESLFNEPVQTIAQAEELARVLTRQRARIPRGGAPGSAKAI
jgi:transcriptional regulator with XRE-family HTH domain